MLLKLLGVICIFILSVSGNTIIRSPEITNNGDWGNWERCPFGKYAQAAQLKTDPFQGIVDDDTASNSLRLYCGDPADLSTQFITSSESNWGRWGNVYSCRSDGRPLTPDGYISGFQLRVEPSSASGDNTATNNFRIFCSYPNETISTQTQQMDGMTFGIWSQARNCSPGQAICALQTQVQTDQGDRDDTALNNIAAECCDL